MHRQWLEITKLHAHPSGMLFMGNPDSKLDPKFIMLGQLCICTVVPAQSMQMHIYQVLIILDHSKREGDAQELHCLMTGPLGSI